MMTSNNKRLQILFHLIVCFILIIFLCCCADGYIRHPCIIPKFSQDELKWIDVGKNESLAYVNDNGKNISFRVIERHPECYCEECSSRNVEKDGKTYFYQPNNAFLLFRIDSLNFQVLIIKDSAMLMNPQTFSVILAFAGNELRIFENGRTPHDSTIVANGTSLHAYIFKKSQKLDSELRGGSCNELAISPEHGIMWIEFNNGRKWTNKIVISHDSI